MTRTNTLLAVSEAEAEGAELIETWNDIILAVLDWVDPQGAGVTLERLLAEFDEHPWTKDVPAWRSIVSDSLETDDDFEELRPGVWRIALLAVAS